MPKGAHALNFGFLSRAAGRWNRPGEYGCLYTALTRDGAIAEYRRVLGSTGLTDDECAPRDLVSIIADVKPVLDVTNPAVYSRIGVGAQNLIRDEDEHFEFCRTIADFARSEGYNAVLSPSAASPGDRNLNIYLDARPSDLQLSVGPEREPLNY